MGDRSEIIVYIEGIESPALLDTGATVSTVSEDFYSTYLSHLPIYPVDDIVKIHCADGQELPYKGYVEVGIVTNDVDSKQSYPCLMLVIPDTAYSNRVPAILGTNFINVMMGDIHSRHGDRYLQKAKLTTPWYLAFRCISLREKELSRNKNRLGVVKSAESANIIIPPNSNMVIQGYIDKEVPYQPTCALLQSTSGSVIPTDFDIAPSVVNYDYNGDKRVDVNIANVTTRSIKVTPRSLLCEIQPVTIEEVQSPPQQPCHDLLDLVKISDDNLWTTEQEIAKDILLQNKDIFSMGETDIGHTDRVQHKILLTDDIPFKQRHRRIPPSMIEELRNHLQQLSASGIIRRSESPWASNIVLCRKKSGELRMCVDYRQLNARTIRDSYGLPRIEEILDSLGGNSYYTVLDMKSGYHQVEVLEEHKERTAFTVGPLGFFEYNRLPFGLANAPATYQRLMEDCLGDLNLKICFIYLDDLIIFSRTFEEHVDRLQQVFRCLRDNNLKLSPKKCSFFMEKVKYVGHIVSRAGIEPDPDKVDKVINWPTPTTPDQVRQFLGFVGYYRRFIKDFSKISRPLSDVMPPLTKKSRKNSKIPESWHWGEKQQQAFDHLKQLLSQPPILGYPDCSAPFEIHTDASLQGLGAILYQTQNNQKRVIAYASRGLTKSEKNYPIHKLEFLALKWSVTEKFKDYLQGNQFTVYTDNNPLTYVLSTAHLDATSHRWIAALASYNFSIIYKPGKNNIDADILSRYPDQIETIAKDSVKSICNATHTSAIAECLALTSDTMDTIPMQELGDDIDIAAAQASDPVLRVWMPYVRDQRKPRKEDLPLTPQHLSFVRNFDKLVIMDNVLYRQITIEQKKKYQVVLPSKYIPTILRSLHDDMGHPGKDKLTSLIRDRFYWANMNDDIETWIKQCQRCLLRKTPDNNRAPLVNIQTFQPLELVCIDFLLLDPSKGGYENVLVITDHFTRYAQAIPTRNQTAKTTAEAIFNNFILHYGIPQKIHSDQGKNFESNVIKELCNILGISKTRTTPYHPMGNGVCEKFNQTLINMLATLDTAKKQNWKSYIAPIVHSYNCMRQTTTGHSPFYLMFGREPRLPIDLAFKTSPNEERHTLTKYIDNIREKLQSSYQLAQENIQKSQQRQKKYYDIKVRGAVIEENDRVLVKILAHEGRHKLADKWEPEPYIVVSKPNSDIPVYVVRREDGEGRTRTLHRNHLLPIGFIPESRVDIQPTPKQQKPKPVPRVRRSKRLQAVTNPNHDRDSDSDSTDTEYQHEFTVHDIGLPQQTHHDVTLESVADTEDVEVPGSGGDDHSSVEEQGQPEAGEDAPPSTADAESGDDSVVPEEDEDATQDAGPEPVHTDPDVGQATAADESVERPPRKSARKRTAPPWMTSGDYVMSQQDEDPEWMRKARFLQEVMWNKFPGHEDKIVEGMLHLITK